jgi:hypothetical protein
MANFGGSIMRLRPECGKPPIAGVDFNRPGASLPGLGGTQVPAKEHRSGPYV